MRDWPEKPYLEPKTSGQTYLEWLTTEPPRRTPTPQAPSGLEVLRQLYRQQPHIKAQLLSTARAYTRQGRTSLHQWQWLPPGVTWEALEAALQGIIKHGLAES